MPRLASSLAAVVVVIFVVALSDATCPAGYTQLPVDTGDCFKLYEESLAFADAEKKCVADGGHLASFHTDAELTAIATIVKTTQNPLIGVKCTSDTACTWSDGSAFDKNNFDGGKPNRVYGDCAFMSGKDAKWDSWSCDLPESTYLCRTKNGAPPPAACDDGYALYNGDCFKAFATAKTELDAEKACALDGGHLAAVHSIQENVFIQQVLQQAGIKTNVFIGLQYATKAYVWNDGSDYDYNAFADGFPNTRYGPCVQLVLVADFLGDVGQWTNIFCEQKLPYVCRKTPGPSTTLAPMICDKPFYFNDQGTVYSPGFPLDFPVNVECAYFLAVEPGKIVSATTPVFSIDVSSMLSLYDGLDATLPFAVLSSASDTTKVYTTTQNVLRMTFAGSAHAAGRWELDFETADKPATTTAAPLVGNCPLQNYKTNATIASTNYPANYLPMLDCSYYITSSSGSYVTLYFNDVDTEECCDVVVVYDGPSNLYPVLGRVSGKHAAGEKILHSTSPSMTVEFVTDSLDERKGWSAYAY